MLVITLAILVINLNTDRETILTNQERRADGFDEIIEYINTQEIDGIYVAFPRDYVYKLVFGEKIEHDVTSASYCIGGTRFEGVDDCYGCGDGELQEDDLIPEKYSITLEKKEGIYHLCRIKSEHR
ncbi:MAG: hypothetical protein ACLFTR_02810 [Candidatus Woesearchaeota archaeon]